MQSPEPYPGYNQELAALNAKVAAATAAGAVALPGPLREAFAGEPLVVYGYTLLPVTAGTEVVLTRINSPLLPTFAVMLEHQGKPKAEIMAALEAKVKPEPESLIETVFAFIRPGRELRALLDKGRIAYREAAMDAIGDKLNAVQLSLLYQSCSQHYANCFCTAIQYEASKSDSDNTVFTAPPAETKTASAGGSIPSVS